MCAKMHADEVDIDLSLVRRLIAAQFPRWAGLDIVPVLSSGTVNAVFRLGGDLAVRLPRVAFGVRDVAHERRWVPHLASRLPVPVPVPVGAGRPGEGYPWEWSVVRWLDGANPDVDRMTEPALLAEDLAAFVGALRSITPPSDAPLADRGAPLATRDADARKAIGELHGIIDTNAATTAWEAAVRLPQPPTRSVWMHGDLSPGNVLLRQDRLGAVIDFGCAGVGDPTVDLIVAWNLLPAEARPVFRAALQVDEVNWALGRGWALFLALIQLPYYRFTNPVLAANARHVIREVLTDHGLIG